MESKYFNEFKKFLQVNMPGLLEKFPNKDLKEFMHSNGGVRVKRPETISSKDWGWYLQVEMDWMIENNLSSKEHFVVAGGGLTSIKIKEVVSKKEIDNDTTRVVIKTGNEQQVFDLVGNIDYINVRLDKQAKNE